MEDKYQKEVTFTATWKLNELHIWELWIGGNVVSTHVPTYLGDASTTIAETLGVADVVVPSIEEDEEIAQETEA